MTSLNIIESRKAIGLRLGPVPRPHASPVESSPFHPVLQLQQEIGNQAVQGLLRSGQIRAKLATSRPDDPEEREADAVADRVMRSPAGMGTVGCSCGADGEMCEECQKKQQGTLARKAAGNLPSAGSIPHSFAPIEHILRSPGQPLDLSTRAFFEPRLGRDLSQVRTHSDSAAAASASAIDALAYTAGEHIVFGPGSYVPASESGRRLLAHELTHVVQESSSPLVRRQAVGASRYRPKSDWYWYRDVMMSTDPEFMKGQLRRIIAKRGLKGLDEWYSNLLVEGGVPPQTVGLGVSATTFGYRGRVYSPLNTLHDMQEEHRRQGLPGAVPLAMFTYWLIRVEAEAFLTRFEENAKDNAKHTLEANRQQAKREGIRYGLTGEMVEYTVDTEGGPVDIEYPNFQMDAALPASSGLMQAANVLLQRRQNIEDKKSERDTHFHPFLGQFGSPLFDDEYWPLNAEVQKMETEYKELQSYVTNQYPILGRYSELKTGLDALRTIATKGAGLETANLIGAQIHKTLDYIKTSEEGLKLGQVNVWRLDPVVELTQQTMNVAPGSMEERLVVDKVKEEQPGLLQTIALAVLNIAALLLAGPTGGLSLVVAAGVNVAVTATHIQEYMLQKALSGSALQRAQALSQEDPSLFWLALEIAGTAFDVGTAASAMLKAFRALGPAVKAAETARQGEEATAALGAVRTTAKDVGLAEKADSIIAHIKSGASGEEEAIRSVARGAEETEHLESLAQSAVKERELAEKTAQSVKTLEGGKVTVTKTGDIWHCASPCVLLRDRYANQIAQRPEIEAKLADMEKRAVELAPGAEGDAGRAAIAAEAREIETQLLLHWAEDKVGPQLLKEMGEMGIEPSGIRRILSKGTDPGNVKGNLWDEIFAAEAKKMLTTSAGKETLAGAKLAPEIAEKVEFIPGSSITDTAGEALTDGILGWREGNQLHVVNIYEAKAGQRAATQLRILEERMARIPEKDLSEIRKVAEEEFGKLELMSSESGKPLGITVDQLEQELMKYRVQKQLGGQVRETIERLDVSVSLKSDLNIPTRIKVAGEELEVIGVSGSSRVTGVVPEDLKMKGIQKALQKERLNFHVLPIAMKQAEVENLAKQISDAASRAAKRSP